MDCFWADDMALCTCKTRLAVFCATRSERAIRGAGGYEDESILKACSRMAFVPGRASRWCELLQDGTESCTWNYSVQYSSQPDLQTSA
jgi:hypothetical protein